MNLLKKLKRLFTFKVKSKSNKIKKYNKQVKTKSANIKIANDAILQNKLLEESDVVLNQIVDSIPKEETLYKLSKFFSNFSDNTRLKIISCLSFGELCVSDIAKTLNMNQTTISHQLAYLKTTGTVVTRRDGKTIYYSLATSEIQDCLTCGANFISL